MADSDPEVTRRKAVATGIAGILGSVAGCGGDEGTEGGNGGNGQGGTSGDTGGAGEGRHFVTFPQSSHPAQYEAMRIVNEEWGKLGLDLNWDPQSFPQPVLDTVFSNREFDIAHMTPRGGPARLDPSFFLQGMSSEGPWAVPGYESDRVDELLEEQAKTLDREERREIIYELQKINNEEQIWTVFSSPPRPAAVRTEKFEIPDTIVPGQGFVYPRGVVNITPVDPDDAHFRVGTNASEIAHLNPVATEADPPMRYLWAIYDSLLRMDPNGSAEPWIAEEVRVSGSRSVEVDLMEGLSFHDGEPLTPEDVIYSFELQQELNSPYIYSFIENVENISSEGQTIIFELTEPDAEFLEVGLSEAMILPKHIWEEYENPAEIDNMENPVGSGPFMFSNHREGTVLTLDANEDHPQAPNVDKYSHLLTGSIQGEIEAILGGDSDLVMEARPGDWERIEQEDGITLEFLPSHGFAAIMCNNRQGMPYEDSAFRRALAHAIPRERILEEIYRGRGDLGGSLIVSDNEYWNNPDVEPLQYDMERAREILEDAGYSWDDDGNLVLPNN